jgi:4-oxalocrotonate tautomerase
MGMPHVIVKMHAGRTREQKQELADALNKTLMDVLKSKESSISVGIEDIEPAEAGVQARRARQAEHHL